MQPYGTKSGKASHTIYAGAKPIRGLSDAQFRLAEFALKYPGWHSLGGSGHPNSPEKRTARSLERKGCLEIARHSGEAGRDWEYRWKQSI
jgi:hypothetical protein